MTAADWHDALRAMLPDSYTPEPEPDDPEPAPQARKPRLCVTLDRKRAGKIATIISGFDPDDPRAAEVAAMLKRRLACGGSSRGGEVLIQGDRVNQVRQWLADQGYPLTK